jgi:cysteine desulfurase family protein (TIGR01976 family)
MPVVSFDVARVRGLYPTVAGGIAHLDGYYNALQPESVIRAVITTLRAAPAQVGSRSAGSQRSAAAVERARRAIGDLVGAAPESVVLGGNLSTLLQHLALLLARDWQLGDEIIVSRACHDAHVYPWLVAARTAGAVVRWAEVDVETGELPEWQYDHLLGPHTRLVTLPMANPATGSIPNVRAIADAAHRVGAWVMVDAGAALPYVPVDIAELGADMLGLSVASFGGPTMGALATRSGLLDRIDVDLPAPSPQRFELGSLPVELMDGVVAAVDHLAGLDERATGSRRDRLVSSVSMSGTYSRRLFAALEPRLRALRRVTVLGTADRQLPVAAFTVAGYRPSQVGDLMIQRGVSAWTGAGGLGELMSALGAAELGGAVYIGVMPHNTMAEVAMFLNAVEALVRL